MIDRAKFVQKLKEQKKLNESVQKIVRQRWQVLSEQRKRLKEAIKQIILNEMDAVPHRSTGINVLEDLLKKIVPILEDNYKQMTTDEAQRESFRAHIVNAIQNSLAPTRIAAEEGEEDNGILDINETLLAEALEEADVDIEVGEEEQEATTDEDAFVGDNPAADLDTDVQPGDENKFIDIDQDSNADEPDDFTISGEEETGRNFASEAFDKIETQIVDAYKKLANDEDRESFYDYLITNVKLYMDRFEDELQEALPEPTSETYDQEKEKEKTNSTDQSELEPTGNSF